MTMFGLSKLAAIAALSSITLLAGCLGSQAREKVLGPAARSAWTGVKEDVERGPTPAPLTMATFDAAVQGTDVNQLVGLTDTAWPEIRDVANSNIRAQPWSAGIQASRLETVVQFDRALQALKPPPPRPTQ